MTVFRVIGGGTSTIKIKKERASSNAVSYGRYSTIQQEKEADKENKVKGIKLMVDFAEGESAWWVRLSAARSLGNFIQEPGVSDFLKNLRDKESNGNFKAMLEGMVGKGE